MDFLLRSAQNCEKYTFLDNWRTMTQEGNVKTRQMSPFFYLPFLFELFVTFIFVFEYSQNSFSYGLLFGPFCSVKYLNFGKKLPIRSNHHTLLESRQPEVTKNPYYVFSPEGSQKKGISSWTKASPVSLIFYRKNYKGLWWRSVNWNDINWPPKSIRHK